jgi:hypothetical protein
LAVTGLSINYRIDNREKHILRFVDIAMTLITKPPPAVVR